MRTVTPFIIGTSTVSVKKFMVLNAAGALVWAAAVGSGGYLFGHTLEIFIGKVKSYEIYMVGSVAVVGVLIWIFHFYRCRRRLTKFISESR